MALVDELSGYVGTSEAARITGGSEEAVREWMRTGKLVGLVGPGGRRLILRKSAEQWARVRRRRKQQAPVAAGR